MLMWLKIYAHFLLYLITIGVVILTLRVIFSLCESSRQESHVKYQKTGHGGSHPRLVHEFVSAISEGRQPKINAWEAARYVSIGISAHESALQGGKLVKVRDWGDCPG